MGQRTEALMPDARARQRRLELRLLPDGLVPVSERDFLVEVWRLQAAGHETGARGLLMKVWNRAMDVGNEHAAPLAFRLFKRFGFVTDDEERWSTLPSELTIYRAESDVNSSYGYCWTLDPDVAEMLADRFGLAVSQGIVAKHDVRAYITSVGEEEIIVQKESVRDARMVRP
jgi:hypothetical protein